MGRACAPRAPCSRLSLTVRRNDLDDSCITIGKSNAQSTHITVNGQF